MPSVSTAQQALMGQAYGIKTGSLKPSDLNPKYKKEILNAAKNMTEEELKKFASTKHKGLKHYVSNVDEKGMTIPDTKAASQAVTSGTMPEFHPHGPSKIIPFLDPDSKQQKKGKKNMQNLKDYRDWVKGQ